MDGRTLIGILVCCIIIIGVAGYLIYQLLLLRKKDNLRSEAEPPDPESGGIMQKIVKTIERIVNVFNIIAVVALVAMLLLVCANVVMRYIFKNPIPGTYELTKVLMICLTPAIAVTMMSKQTVWVDVFTSKFSRRAQLISDIISLPLSIGIIGIMAWQGFTMILSSYEKGTYSSIMNFRLPEWPFRIVYFIAMTVTTLAAIAFTIDRFMQYKNGGVPVDKDDVDRAIEEAGDLSAPSAQTKTGGIHPRSVSGCGSIPRPNLNEAKGGDKHE